MPPRLIIEVLGDTSALERSYAKAARASRAFSGTAKEQAANVIVSQIQERKELQRVATEYRLVATNARRGSEVQVTAARLAADAERHLAATLGVVNRESHRSAAGFKVFHGELGKATRGALSGTGVFQGFGRSIAFASGGFLAFAGAGAFLRDSISAARDAQKAQASLAAQMKASNESFEQNKDRVEAASLAYGKFGFENDEVTRSLTVLERGTGKISVALGLQTTAANLARAKNLDLAAAANVLAKVFGGQETALRRAVPGLSKDAHGLDLIREASKKLAGQAAANTTEAEKFNAILHNTKEIIGTALLPTLNAYLTSLGNWLDKMNKSGELQRDVNEAVRTGQQVFAGIKAVVEPLVHVFKGFSDAVGGSKHALELLAITITGFKVAKLLNAIGGIGLKSGSAATQVGLLRSRLLLLSKIGVIGIGLELVFNRKGADKAISGFLRDHGLGAFTGKEIKTVPQLLKAATKSGLEGNAARDALRNPEAQAAVKKYLAALANHAVGDLVKALPKEKTLVKAAGVAAVTVPQTVAGLGKRGLSNLKPGALNKLALTEAARTASTVDDLRALREQRALLGKAIDAERARLASAPTAAAAQKFADNLGRLLDKDAAAFSEITSIENAAASKTAVEGRKQKAARDKRAAAVKAIVADAARQRKALLADVARQDASRSKALTLRPGQLENAVLANVQASNEQRFSQALGLGKNFQGQSPLKETLSHELARVKGAIKGTLLDTSKNTGLLATIGKGLDGQFGTLTDRMKSNVRKLLDALSGELNKGGAETLFKKVSPNKLLAGIPGLSPAQQRALRARLSQVGVGGTIHGTGSGAFGQPIVVHTTVNLDGKKVASNTTKHQQTGRRRNPPQKRGPFAGQVR